MFVNELFPILNASISNAAKIVFIAYAGHANSEGVAWPKTRLVCELTGFHSSTVRHARSELVRAGLLEHAGDGVFKIVLPTIAENHTAQNLDMVASAPVIAESATTAAPAPKPEPAPAPEQPTGDNPSPVAAPNLKPAPETPVAPVPVVVHETTESEPQAALPIICAPQQGELLPAPAKRKRSSAVSAQGELLPIEKKGRATRLPEDWRLPRKWGIWAMEEYGFTEDEVRFHEKQFARHWWSSSKSNAYKVSWYMTWQKWMGDEYQKKQRYNNRPQQKSKTRMAMERLIAMSGGDFEIPF